LKICTDEPADKSAKRLLNHLDKDDSLLVIEVAKDRQGWLQIRYGNGKKITLVINSSTFVELYIIYLSALITVVYRY